MFVFGFTTMYTMSKVMPVMSVYAEAYALGPNVGYLITFFSVVGIIVAFPGVWILRNLGIKFSIFIAGLFSLIGSIMMLLAPNGEVLLVARVFEGAGMGLIAAVGPNVMPRLFSANKMGLVMGIWSAWTCPGILLATLVGPQVFASFGLPGLDWLGIILEVLSLVLILAFCRVNAVSEMDLNVKAKEKNHVRPRNYVTAAFIAGLSFVSYAIIFGQFQAFYPTFLQSSFEMSIAMSALPATIVTLVAIPVNVVTGIVIHKCNLRKACIVATQLILTVVIGYYAWTTLSPAMPWIAAVVLGIIAGAMPVAIRTIIPFLVTDERKMDYLLGVMAFTTNIGAVLGGPWGALSASVGFANAALYVFVPVGAIFTLLCLVFIKSDKKIAKVEAAELSSDVAADVHPADTTDVSR